MSTELDGKRAERKQVSEEEPVELTRAQIYAMLNRPSPPF